MRHMYCSTQVANYYVSCSMCGVDAVPESSTIVCSTHRKSRYSNTGSDVPQQLFHFDFFGNAHPIDLCGKHKRLGLCEKYRVLVFKYISSRNTVDMQARPPVYSDTYNKPLGL